MSVVDDLLDGNARFVDSEWDPGDAELGARPAKRLAVVACMDTRYNVERVLGLAHGDAKIIRNAGNRIDDATLRSLVVAVHELGVEHVAVMGHSDCGMTGLHGNEAKLARTVAETTGVSPNELDGSEFQEWLGCFADVDANVRQSVEAVRDHPYMPKALDVFGLVYDNDTGRVRRVE